MSLEEILIKKKIIEILMQPYHKNPSVVPIVGIGGMGKTALAKLVYNDDDVKAQFELRLWVCVPENFDLKKIIKGIIKDTTIQSLSNLDIQQLQTILRSTIKDKKFLLVLDDVWSNNRNRWEELKALLTEGASGSKIIVTTRSLEVASIMGTHLAHNLKGLSHEDSMTLLKKWAFDEKEKQPCRDLLEIGNDIVKKCQGVPLLVKTLGSVLYTKDEKRHWAHIRDSETWKLVKEEEDILPVLKLSYDHLPLHLKHCFATLSLFDKGSEIYNPEIGCIWRALGLISLTGEEVALEDVAFESANELWKRSLIQREESFDPLLSSFKVHDLVHSLATIVAQNYCSSVDLDTAEIFEGVQMVSLSGTSLRGISNSNGVPPFLRKPTSKRLRAIVSLNKVNDRFITREFVRTCISKCNNLRFLDLSNGTFEKLPSSICNLKHLRTLIIANNNRLKKLLDTICDLQSLQFLELNDCSELGDLPRNMNRLVNLRFLQITTKQKNLQDTGIQYLENLQFLILTRCQNLEVLFEGTCRLTRLRRLAIANCGKPISLPFVELIGLHTLCVNNCKLMLTEENKSNFPSNLRVLAIVEFEQVMELLQCLDKSACTLESFFVINCSRLMALPEWLPNHTRLKSIRLIKCGNLLSMPQGISSLTALKELCVDECGELSERCRPTTGEDWPKIAHIPKIELDETRVQWTED